MESDNLDIQNDWPLIGNRHITLFLEKSIANGKVAGTYIFLGPNNLGKTTVATFFAKSLLCEKKEEGRFSPPCEDCSSCQQIRRSKKEEGEEGVFRILHGDFHLVRREKDKKNISIEQIREFIKILGMSSFLGSYKIGVVKNAEVLSQEAANALLKTLEEPKERVVIILIASSLEGLPATIVSRSQVFNFYPVKNDIIYDFLIKSPDCPRSLAKNISRLSVGRPALAIKFLEDEEFYKDYLAKANSFLGLFDQDVNERLREVESLIGREGARGENVKRTLSLLGIWQGLVRDLLLLYAGSDNLIQHEVMGEKLRQISKRFNKNSLLALNKILKTGEDYIKMNVNPKLVLENIVCHI